MKEWLFFLGGNIFCLLISLISVFFRKKRSHEILDLGIFDLIPVPIFCLNGNDPDFSKNTCTYGNQTFLRLAHGKTPAPLKTLLRPVNDEYGVPCPRTNLLEKNKGRIYRLEMSFETQGNVKRHFEILCSSVSIPGTILCVAFDMTQRVVTEKTITENFNRLGLALESMADCLFDYNVLDGTVHYQEPYWTNLLGYDQGYFGNTFDTWYTVLHQDDINDHIGRFKMLVSGKLDMLNDEFRVRTRNGAWLWVLFRAKVVERDVHGAPVRIIALISDISSRKAFELEKARLEEELKKAATRDKLTGALNRQCFETEFFRIMGFKRRKSSPCVSIILFDIDHFKKVNDTFGHLQGDAVLKNVSKIVEGTIREKDVFARWGGEEFILLCEDTDAEGARILAEKIRAKISTTIFDKVGHITVSFGVAESNGKDTIETLTNRADEALYEAKRTGRNKVCVAK